MEARHQALSLLGGDKTLGERAVSCAIVGKIFWRIVRRHEYFTHEFVVDPGKGQPDWGAIGSFLPEPLPLSEEIPFPIPTIPRYFPN
jgi:hypothetical protein